MQKLIQPLNNMRLTASYKNAAYKNKYGFTHYGIDCADAVAPFERTVWSMGNGSVIDTGSDSCFGNYVVLRYAQAYNRNCKRYADLIVRMFHFNLVYVKNGQSLTKDTRLGEYGDTGTYASGKHLHIEVDEDTKYTHYTPTITKNSTKFFSSSNKPISATDSTMSNPLEWMHCKTDAKDYQTYATDGTSYINAIDKMIASITV